MKLTELPLDTWVVVEPVSRDEVQLLSRHATQCQAEAECKQRNQGLPKAHYRAFKTLKPIASAHACAAMVTRKP